MRRKSTRNAAKASTSPEKTVEPTSTRRSRRHSKRHKRSSSRSSSEGSDDVSLKTVAQQMAEVPAEDVPNINLPGEEDTDQPIWKVKQSAAPSGEIQKIKICLTRPPPASPDKVEPTGRRLRNKSGGSQVEEDITSPDEKTPRKSKHRNSPGAYFDEIEEHSEESEDKKGKGKSKTKHKSKSEKTPKIQDLQDQTQSEISENVQVTPQSPQAAIDIRVDNESVPPIEHESIETDVTETNSVLLNATTSDVTSSSDHKIIEIEEKEDDTVIQSTTEDSDDVKPPTEISLSKIDVGFKGFDQNNEETATQEEIEPETTMESLQSESIEVQNEEEVSVEHPNDVQEIIPPSSDLQPELIQENKNDEVQEVEEEPISLVKPADIEESEENKEMEEVSQESTSPVRSESLEKKDVEVEAESKPEEMQISEERDEESTVSSIPEPEKPQNEEEQTPEVIPETMEVEEVHKQPIRRESKTESSSSDEPEIVEQKDEADEQETQKSPVHNKDESSTRSITIEESQQSDEDSRSADVIIIDSSSTPKKEESSFNLTQSFSPDVREIVEANKELQCMKDQIRDLFPTPNPVKRRRRWGTSLVGLELLAPSLKKIDVDTIKELCPDLQLLEESELRMEIREVRDRRKSLTEQREKKIDRKVSIEHQSTETDHNKRLETQDSVTSSEMEEINEPEVDNSNIIAMNRKISIVDDTASKLKPPPSPAKNPVADVLYITNLVRPFTLKQLKELLERTGKIKENGFWTDRIKSKCYVYYETIEEAEATRNALHGVHWPIGNGKKLVIDYATPEDLEKARNPAPAPVVVPEEKVPEKENQVPSKKNKIEEPEKVIKERERHRSETHVREWDIGKEDLNKLRSRSREREGRNDRNDRRKHRRSPSPVEDFISRKQRKKEEDVPQKLMDDLFRKTKTTPSIYWLPLTPEEIATKQQQRLLRMAEHKRRMEESSRGRGGDYGRGALPYRRRYD